MLAGLLFAHHDADDRPGQLTATLPFGGSSVIEYQARLLAAVGASQLVVMVGRLTPELLGAIGRIGKRGIAVDAVRTAEEVAAKLHPLARVLMLADGLVTTQEIVDGMARGEGDALLVVDAADAPARYERLGGGAAWAGIARLEARRIVDVAALPRDYDFQSTALRLADQARAVHLMLPPGAIADGHGIEHAGGGLTERGRAVLAATVADRRNWFNAALVAPLARATVPRLVARGVGTIATGVGGALLSLAGAVGIVAGVPGTGLTAMLAGAMGLGVARVLALLRDEEPLGEACVIAQGIAAAAGVMALGWSLTATTGAVMLVVALVAVVAGLLGERATPRRSRRRWWGGGPAYLALATPFAVVGWPTIGLVAVLLYATATLVAAIEALRTLVNDGLVSS
ncbi:hypothetical protein [Sphingomonas rubra]|uniref:Uncharacterized protein n=1 Tax=Sphingomonas rubra TaxID=634430 RepID=A0A1I5S0V5_9SPHN|nr:hypothetical protein [Sphingomonas rubra]SFP64353.1 hypothetical protein SAMN04488241_104274 [Sphingomonas rubra]